MPLDAKIKGLQQATNPKETPGCPDPFPAFACQKPLAVVRRHHPKTAGQSASVSLPRSRNETLAARETRSPHRRERARDAGMLGSSLPPSWCLVVTVLTDLRRDGSSVGSDVTEHGRLISLSLLS
ncbi:hypothetical protein VTJ04DRAFT_3651 [Mycothermus thermophilus]|uniref:uncharacterized protein n=1 Tax=Humicola insolens TaxID=85995 RepID=UPI003742F770